MEKEYLTKEKFEELTKSLEILKTEKRKKIAEDLEYAKSLGDLSENAEYHDARSAQAELEEEIRRLEETLKNTEIIGNKKHSTDEVSVGSTVVLKKSDGKETVFTIVGSAEVNLTDGKISANSPIGKNAIGKKKGDCFEVETPRGIIQYEISDIK